MIAVLIPVLSRPANAAPLASSLVANTHSAHRLVFLCSPGDEEEIAACRATYGEVLIVPWEPDRADFAKKIGYGFSHTHEPWIFQGADDLRFEKNWDAHALAVAAEKNVGVIGTNDLANPQVRRGIHSTHTLISRAYIEEYGGTVDNTGLVFSESYSHQYCDNEFIETASMRGQFAFSKRSIVEHLHPHWGKAEMDSTYTKALLETQEDRNLYVSRTRRLRNKTARQATIEARQAVRAERLEAKRAALEDQQALRAERLANRRG